MYEDNLEERYGLSMNRIREIVQNCGIGNQDLADWFSRTADFILFMAELKEKLDSGWQDTATLQELQELNRKLYEDVTGEAYQRSFADPAYAVARLGSGYGQLFSFIYVEIRGMIAYVYEKNQAAMTVLAELFVELYCMCSQSEEPIPSYEALQETVYWYVSDYSDDFMEARVASMLDPSDQFAVQVINRSDLQDLRYLYRFGEYITDNELQTARYLNSLPQEQICAMAATFTEGYRKGFILGRKDLSRKKTVSIRCCLGFERLVREEIRQFSEMGLSTTLYRAAVSTVNKRMHIKIGYYGASPNKQMEYDHRFDSALYLDAAFVERKLGALKLAYEKHKEEAAVFGGPAVMEVFGENPFTPQDKEECPHLDSRQQKLLVRYDNEAGSIVNTFIPGEERSFTIIAYPLPEIGPDYPDIFQEIVRINTLDYEKYKRIQQKLVDALDGSAYAHVRGCNGNETDIRISLMPVTKPESQTIFENCLADVNIPLGEVFTSPVLQGTSGLLQVSSVYLNDLKFTNLKVQFENGFVTGYSCDNFEDPQKGRAFFKENVLFSHETLPMGEFAIGTNTTAYVMAQQYDILYKLPILIVEKMGPHFAIGDTCYSRAEEVQVYNPDGKEIISRDNAVSLKRKESPEQAYFNCHTDITIPYEEIGSITAVKPDGTEIPIIRNGRFVLEGTEELNEPFHVDANSKTK